jgi:glucose/arabinose dehydrogenase
VLENALPMKRFLGSFLVMSVSACSSSGNVSSDDGGSPTDATKTDGSRLDAAHDAVTDHNLPIDTDAKPPTGAFCALPGSVVFTPSGPQIIPGGDSSAPSLGWLTLPPGFCAHYYGTVPMARQLRFAPDGRLFVASPCCGTTGGANNGISSIVILPDADQNGQADDNISYLTSLPVTQGLLFTGGYLYFQDGVTIKRVAFANGDVAPSSSVETVTTITAPQSAAHWPKNLDIAQDGTIYVTNGGDQGDQCLSTRPVRGAIFKIEADGGNTEVAQGFRNPIALRCDPVHDQCYALELALDYSATEKGREKLLPVHQGDDWGYPCCATQNVPYTNATYSDTGQIPDCSGVARETVGFTIGETPFGLDFESGKWPAPWTNHVFVAMHGVFGSWLDARILAVARDPSTGLALPADDLDGGESSNMQDFALGWDDGHQDHGRPGAVTFAPDGRLFVGDDQQGAIIWIAPVDLMP